MNAELDALLRALDAFFEASDDNADRLLAIYNSRLDDAAERIGRPAAEIDKFVRVRFNRWKNEKPSTLPPKA